MKPYPSIPPIADAPDSLLGTGHLWIVEKVDGAHFRFQLRQSGRLRFGDRNRVYEDAMTVPEPYQHAVRHVQAQLDRQALRRAVDDVEQYVFFGEAMHRQTIDYEWDRTPSFLGFDVWSVTEETFRPPDAAEQIFDRLGLHPVTVFERERRARDFDPNAYSIPQSAWYEGPAEGVIVRNKRGERAKLVHPERPETDESAPVDASAAELAATYATQHRFEKLATTLEKRGQSVTFQVLYEHVLEEIMREAHTQLDGDQHVDLSEFRSEVAALTREFIE